VKANDFERGEYIGRRLFQVCSQLTHSPKSPVSFDRIEYLIIYTEYRRSNRVKKKTKKIFPSSVSASPKVGEPPTKKKNLYKGGYRKKSQVPSVCANRIILSFPLNHKEEKRFVVIWYVLIDMWSVIWLSKLWCDMHTFRWTQRLLRPFLTVKEKGYTDERWDSAYNYVIIII